VAGGAVVLRYLSERIDDRAAGGAAPRVDPPLETVQTVVAMPGSPSPDATRPDPTADAPDDPARFLDDDIAPEDQPDRPSRPSRPGTA